MDKPLNVLIVSCSLNPQSRSALLAEAARSAVVAQGALAQVIDLRETQLPLCDGATVYGDEAVAAMGEAVREADAVLLAMPVYNYDVNAAAKNLIELTGRAWMDKPVGFLLAAGGQGSYMSVMPFANSLMLDFRCWVVPRFVYAKGEDFVGDAVDDVIGSRINELGEALLRLTTGLRAGLHAEA